MRYSTWEEFWWNDITGARTVVDRVVMALLENKMVVLKVPSDLPWRYSMRSAIQSTFNERTISRNVVIETIDAVDNNPDDLEPGRFILQRYASLAVSTGYREKSRKTIQSYISEMNVIRNRIIWVKGLSVKAAEKWLQFCRGFSPKSASDGLFVLEVHGKITVAESKTIDYISFDDCVSSYDVQQFNSFILDEKKEYNNEWKRYISTVAAILCGVDAEISELLLRLVSFRTESAIDGIRRIAENGEYSRRGAEADSNHPLWFFRNNEHSELQRRIWIAQVQVLFPLIELERQQLIAKWWEQINQALSENTIEQFGSILYDPSEVELGTLRFMMNNKDSHDYRLLYIPDDDDRQKIAFLHHCRNKIAHMSCCSPDEVSQLLD